MDAPLHILFGVVVTSFPIGFLLAILFPRWRQTKTAMITATSTAVLWAIGYGIYGWAHRMDWEHIRNYPLWMHIILMTFSGVFYAVVAFLPALAGATLSRRLTQNNP